MAAAFAHVFLSEHHDILKVLRKLREFLILLRGDLVHLVLQDQVNFISQLLYVVSIVFFHDSIQQLLLLDD